MAGPTSGVLATWLKLRRGYVTSAPAVFCCEVPVVMVFGGCMGAIVAMEIVLKGDPKQLSRPRGTSGKKTQVKRLAHMYTCARTHCDILGKRCKKHDMFSLSCPRSGNLLTLTAESWRSGGTWDSRTNFPCLGKSEVLMVLFQSIPGRCQRAQRMTCEIFRECLAQVGDMLNVADPLIIMLHAWNIYQHLP